MPLMRHFVLVALAVAWLPAQWSFAQLPGRGASEQRDRGLLGRLGARREERAADRLPPAGPPNPNGPNANALGGNALRNSAAATLNRQLSAGVNPAGGNAAAAGPALNNRLPNNAASRSAAAARGAGPTPAPSLTGPDVRNAYYPPNAVAAGGVAQASASLPPNRLPYNGPGVMIRLPEELRAEVNYLVDDAEHLVVHPGEEQLLRLKGDYEVRFSRGVTNDGRSYGEGRYTVTEGIYRFDVTDKGWELFREGDATDLRRRVALAEQRAVEFERRSEANNRARSTGEFSFGEPRKEQPPASIVAPESKSSAAAGASPLPSPTPSSEAQDTLPAPRSILEP